RDMREDILNSLDKFEAGGLEENTGEHPGIPLPTQPIDMFRRFEVNVLVEHEPGSGAPVLFLELPTYRNLVGRIEHEARFGMLTTDFMQLKAGALHRASGGFLIIRMLDLMQQPFAWESLKRALSTGQVMIEDAQSSGMSVMATQTLEPDPIPLDVTVVLVGSAELYYALYSIEDDFRDLFRVKSDFGEFMKRDDASEQYYASFIATRCHEDNLPHFAKDAVGRIVEYGSWLVSDQRRLSTQFGLIAPLVTEAAFFARHNGHDRVTAADVNEAIRERDYRNNEPEELAQEHIADGMIYIDVTGEVSGQVNGLVVMTMGDHTFGMPTRITARVYMGREGIVQIDRETEMTGNIHDKGVLTLEG
ncbi:MAG TPA: ATP-binding protein, partial [Aggregatilineales bacterium]|nr:ATP-binding protein [Aggregatilineales bacterium]